MRTEDCCEYETRTFKRMSEANRDRQVEINFKN